METMLSNVTNMWDDLWERRDKRMDEYPLMGNPLHTAAICCIYFYLIAVAGPRYMKARKPMNIRSFLIVYNASMVVLSLYMFVQVSGDVLRNRFWLDLTLLFSSNLTIRFAYDNVFTLTFRRFVVVGGMITVFSASLLISQRATRQGWWRTFLTFFSYRNSWKWLTR